MENLNTNLPIFLVGSVRSGTTLLRLMLDHHPDVAFNLESEYLVTQIADDGTFPNVQDYKEFLLADRVFQHSEFEIKDNLSFVDIVRDFLDQKKKRDGKSFVGATVHNAFSKLSLIWPEAKYIYIYRDGRDVANSIVQMGWAGNSYVAADDWLEIEKEWDTLRKTLPDSAWLEIKYEELTSDPKKQLTKICEFIGTSFSEKMFDYVHHSRYKFPDSAFNYQWKKNSPKNIRLMEKKLADRLVARGYEISNYSKINLSEIEKKILYFHSRVKCFYFRLKHYGVALVLLEAFTRRLSLEKINQKLNQRIDQVIDLNLK